MDGVAKELEGIRRAFERQNEIAQAMLDAMPKPENRFMGVLKGLS